MNVAKGGVLTTLAASVVPIREDAELSFGASFLSALVFPTEMVEEGGIQIF